MTKKEYISKSEGVQLICLPPSLIDLPISGMSVLKSYLQYRNIISNVQYLNLYINENCFFKSSDNDFKTLLPYIYLYNKIVLRDEAKSEITKLYIESIYGKFFLKEKTLSDELFDEYIAQLYNCIEGQLDLILDGSPRLIAFTSKFDQWIPATLCAYLVRIKNPYVPIVIGGWSHKDAALSILKIAPCFDFSIWGEGEIPIAELYNSITNNLNISNIPRLLFRDNEPEVSSKISNSESFVNLNVSPLPDFTDYIYALKKWNKEDTIVLPIERSRGCNWNQCCFCYLSQGYHYRIKDNDSFISQIKSLIDKYKIYHYQIMDNDFVGNDIEIFKQLLIRLGNLRVKFPKFKIKLVEIITKSLTKEIIHLMYDSGIERVQIGLEAISQNLLTKIKKRQSLAENIFFIREAQNAGIIISGANVIIETLDEDDNDITESIKNLFYFRFFINNDNFDLNIIPLGVANYSKYLNIIKNKNLDSVYDSNNIAEIISDKIFLYIDRFSLFDFTKNVDRKSLWELFSITYSAYKKNKYSYRVFYKTNSIVYKEYSKGYLVKELYLDDIVMIKILYLLQDSVLSFERLLYKLKEEYVDNEIDISPDMIKLHLSQLYEEGIVYYSDDLSQITTIIVLKKE